MGCVSNLFLFVTDEKRDGGGGGVTEGVFALELEVVVVVGGGWGLLVAEA